MFALILGISLGTLDLLLKLCPAADTLPEFLHGHAVLLGQLVVVSVDSLACLLDLTACQVNDRLRSVLKVSLNVTHHLWSQAVARLHACCSLLAGTLGGCYVGARHQHHAHAVYLGLLSRHLRPLNGLHGAQLVKFVVSVACRLDYLVDVIQITAYIAGIDGSQESFVHALG